jgi:hypothetical protein
MIQAKPVLIECAIILLAFSACKRSPQATVRLADQLAAHPSDPTKPPSVKGVSDADLHSAEAVDKAVTACLEAIQADPNEPRYRFELGRVLFVGGLVDEAEEHLEAAAQKGHGGACYYLAQLQLESASELLQKASSAGFKPANEITPKLQSILLSYSKPKSSHILLWILGLGTAGIAAFYVLRNRRKTTKATVVVFSCIWLIPQSRILAGQPYRPYRPPPPPIRRQFNNAARPKTYQPNRSNSSLRRPARNSALQPALRPNSAPPISHPTVSGVNPTAIKTRISNASLPFNTASGALTRSSILRKDRLNLLPSDMKERIRGKLSKIFNNPTNSDEQ